MSLVERRKQVAHSQRKGKRGELEVVHLLWAHGWPNARRNADGRRQRTGDITDGPAATHIEIKRKRSVDICASFDQIVRDADPLDLPLLIHRADDFPWLASCPDADFEPLRELWGGTVYRKMVPEFKRISVCRHVVATVAAAPEGHLPMLRHRPIRRHPWLATLLLSDLLPLLRLRERG